MITEKKLDFLIKNQYNVLLVGKKGVGKSSIVIDSFNRNGLKWLYFSASTLDPWVDFVGVPKENTDEKGNVFIDLIRPKCFQEDNVEAIFLDEYNRANKKIKNAVMELIQFKSINGKKFNSLKMVWAAINPEDDDSEEYDVEKLDPAQRDRFHAILEVPYKPDNSYFKNKYGDDMASSAISWWNDLPKETKDLVSPRRLDYALDFYKKDGDIRDVIPVKANVQKLIFELNSGPISKKLESLFVDTDENIKNYFAVENNYNMSVEKVVNTSKYLTKFLDKFPEEKISDLLATSDKIKSHVINIKNYIKFQPILDEIVNANTNYKLSREIDKFYKKNKISRYAVTTKAGKVGQVQGIQLQNNFPTSMDQNIVNCFNLFTLHPNFSLIKHRVYNELSKIYKQNAASNNGLDLESSKLALSLCFYIMSRSHSYTFSANGAFKDLQAMCECFYFNMINKGFNPGNRILPMLNTHNGTYGYIPNNTQVKQFNLSKIKKCGLYSGKTYKYELSL